MEFFCSDARTAIIQQQPSSCKDLLACQIRKQPFFWPLLAPFSYDDEKGHKVTDDQ
jgi:hypothetical protein